MISDMLEIGLTNLKGRIIVSPAHELSGVVFLEHFYALDIDKQSEA
jgi:hypothetical protein